MRFNRQSAAHRLIAGLAISAVLALTACAVKGRTLEGISADYSVQVGKAVAVAQEAVGTFGKASADPKVRNASVLALKGLDVVNVKGLELADLLDKIVALRRANQPIDDSLIAQALALVDALDSAIDLDVIPHLGDAPEARAALEAARAVSKLVLSFQFQLGQLKGV